MAKTEKKVIDILKQVPPDRKPTDIETVVPWLRKRSQLLHGLDKGLLIELVRNCHYEKVTRDDVVIRQGDRGNCFYIMLNGVVSVYVDAKKSGEDATPLPDSSTWQCPIQDQSDTEPHKLKAPDRSLYGRFVVKFEGGRSFGEVALMTDDEVRNATIIADENVDLMVIYKDLYDSTIKENQEQEYLDRRDFVKTHPLFSRWSESFKHLLEMSLIKEVFSYDTLILRQGQHCNGLTFIRRGHAQVLVEPCRHSSQFPQLAPFSTTNDVYELELERPRKKAGKLVPLVTPQGAPLQQQAVRVRRSQGYAAAERKNQQRNIVLCHVEEGEVLGDIECIMGLDTYTQTVVCTSQVEVYTLTAKNLDRLILKKNPQTLELLRMAVQTKLLMRSQTVQGKLIPLLQHLKFKMTEEKKPVVRRGLPERMSNELPDRDILFQHLLTAYKEDKAELVEPLTPGSIYYREMMRERAKVRDFVRRRGTYYRERIYRTKKKLISEQKPRTLRSLRSDLQKQMEDAQQMELKAHLKVTRQMDQEQMEQEIARYYAPIFHKNKNVERIKDRLLNSLDTVDIYHPEPSLPSQISNQDTHSENIPQKESESQPDIAPNNTSHSELVDDGNIENKDDVKPESTLENDNASEHLEGDKKNTPSDHASNKTDDATRPTFVSESPERKSLYQSENLSESVDDEKIETSHSKPMMNIFSPFMRRKLRMLSESPSYRDWETSENTLTYLENRIKNFGTQSDQPKRRGLFVAKLKRFEKGEDDLHPPRPGGSVVVVKRACALQGIKFTGADHQHVHYNIVNQIPHLDKLKRQKMMKQVIVDKFRKGNDSK